MYVLLFLSCSTKQHKQLMCEIILDSISIKTNTHTGKNCNFLSFLFKNCNRNSNFKKLQFSLLCVESLRTNQKGTMHGVNPFGFCALFCISKQKRVSSAYHKAICIDNQVMRKTNEMLTRNNARMVICEFVDLVDATDVWYWFDSL